jgi:glycine/D-amino acid oxidase-like deaminating enzyme
MVRIAVVGAGVVGAAIAYELSYLNNAEVVLLEAQQAGQGATAAALGVGMAVVSRKTSGRGWRLRQASLARLDTLIGELENLTGEGIAVNRYGLVLLQFDPQERDRWRQLQERRRQQGYILDYWSKEELLERCPQVQSPQVIGAVYAPGDRQVNPQQLTQALLRAAQQRGVQFHPATPITTLPPPQPSLTLVTAQRSWTVDYLILSAGLGTAKLAPAVALEPVLGQALELELPQPLSPQDFNPVLSGQDLHIVPLGGNRYALGATLEFPPAPANPQLLEQLLAQAICFCPGLGEGKILRTWQGLRPRPRGEAAPVIRPLPGYSQVLLATGHYRNGILLAPATALAVKEWLTSQL